MHSRFIDLAKLAAKEYKEMEDKRFLTWSSKQEKLNFEHKDEATIKADIISLYHDRDPTIPATSDFKNLVTILYFCLPENTADKTSLYLAIDKVIFKHPDRYANFIKQAKLFTQPAGIEEKLDTPEAKPFMPLSITEVITNLFKQNEKLNAELTEIKRSTSTQITALQAQISDLSEIRRVHLQQLHDLEEMKKAQAIEATTTELKLHNELIAAKKQIADLFVTLTTKTAEAELHIQKEQEKQAPLEQEIKSQLNHLKAKDIINRALTEKLEAAEKKIRESITAESKNKADNELIYPQYCPSLFSVKRPPTPDEAVVIDIHDAVAPVVTTLLPKRRGHKRSH